MLPAAKRKLEKGTQLFANIFRRPGEDLKLKGKPWIDGTSGNIYRPVVPCVGDVISAELVSDWRDAQQSRFFEEKLTNTKKNNMKEPVRLNKNATEKSLKNCVPEDATVYRDRDAREENRSNTSMKIRQSFKKKVKIRSPQITFIIPDPV